MKKLTALIALMLLAQATWATDIKDVFNEFKDTPRAEYVSISPFLMKIGKCFIDEEEVSSALLKAVEQWGKEKGMEAIVGPLGFTDMDAEGMLVEGFDQLSTMATIYNYSYYPEHMEQLGFEKEADWVEYKLSVPHQLPEKFVRISEIILQKYNLKIKKLKRSEIKKQNYGQKIFDLINEAYAPLYGYSQMTQGQINQYIKMYLPLIDLRMVSLVEDAEGNLVAVGIAMPSLSKALQKAKGKMLPFGWYHLLKALFIKRPRVLDLLLVGVKPEYQSKGVNALLFYDLVPIFQQMGFEYGESNPELELNKKVQAQWSAFESVQHKRRRAYKKMI